MATTVPATSGETANEPEVKHAPRNWYVVLQLVDGKVEPQGDWRTQMQVGDHVQFVSPDGMAVVSFKPMPLQGCKGQTKAGLLPFAETNISGGDGQKHRVVNACRSVMSCTIIDHSGNRVSYEGIQHGNEVDESDDAAGTNVCTGGTRPC